ncbi:hypothetical protein [Larkinella terrae]|uniref:Lipoprotein n=1 Tax=Larkinella terrae TaxID=2025311 RepID=A0A7K0EPK4_9BACT|nr:hypothetical protein [Larkinella terrae]MRS63773.1 hypothetical protein [Larkinella terrae]
MTPFKSLYGLLLVGLLAVGCEKDKSVTPAEESKPVTVKINQSARVNQNVTLNVESINDSRCPANALCVWLGNATVKFSLKNDSEVQTGELCLGQCGQQLKNRDAVTVQLGGVNYEVALSEVKPFPGTQPDGTPKEAVVTVNRKN